jgi:hypothetical protein
MLLDTFEGFNAIPGFSNNLYMFLGFQERAQSLAHDRLVFSNNDFAFQLKMAPCVFD